MNDEARKFSFSYGDRSCEIEYDSVEQCREGCKHFINYAFFYGPEKALEELARLVKEAGPEWKVEQIP